MTQHDPIDLDFIPLISIALCYLTVRRGKWPIEIDGLPFLKMVDLSMANC